MYTVEQVRQELQLISRRHAQMVTFSKTRQRLLYQIEILTSTGRSMKAAKKQLASVTSALSAVLAGTIARECMYIKNICAMSDVHRTILMAHYIEGLAMRKVSERVGYSERQGKEHLRRALKELTDLLNSKRA